MTNRKFKYGPLIPEPARFNPVFTYADARYVYKIDFELGIAKKSPLYWDSNLPTGFYTLIEEKSVKPRGRRQLVPKIKIWSGSQLSRGFLVMAMIAGLVALYPFYPGVSYQVKQGLGQIGYNQAVAAPVVDNQLFIPKIGVKTKILEGADLGVLDRQEGVWHQGGGIKDNFVLAGHRFKFLPPNTATFYNLGELQSGDTIAVDWFGKRFNYTVKQTQVVPEGQTELLNASNGARITLYTCNDKRQTERIVVIAEPAT